MNLNKALIIGNLTRDPELRQTATGQAVCSFGVATNSFFTDKSGAKQRKAEFHNLVAWGRQAEIINQFLKKGSMIFVEGRLQTRSWSDNQGRNHKATEIICERIQLGPRFGGAGQKGEFSPSDAPSSHGSDSQEAEELKEQLPEINIDDEGEIRPEDVPF